MEFNISVIGGTKIVTNKFLHGVLLRMHDRLGNGVFHYCLPKLPISKSKTTSIYKLRKNLVEMLSCH